MQIPQGPIKQAGALLNVLRKNRNILTEAARLLRQGARAAEKSSSKYIDPLKPSTWPKEVRERYIQEFEERFAGQPIMNMMGVAGGMQGQPGAGNLFHGGVSDSPYGFNVVDDTPLIRPNGQHQIFPKRGINEG